MSDSPHAVDTGSAGETSPPVSMRDVFWYFLRLGWLAFGGPVGQIGLMHLEVVERRKWISEEEFVRRKREEYAADIDILHLASELVVDAMIEPDDLRAELIRRFALAETKDRGFSHRHNPITPA